MEEEAVMDERKVMSSHTTRVKFLFYLVCTYSSNST